MTGLKRFRWLAWTISLLLMAGAAQGQNNLDLNSLDDGELSLNLSITETTRVEQDLLTAVLQFSARGKDKVALQDQINTRINEALTLLENGSGNTEYSTQRYRVYPLHDSRESADLQNPTWQAQQSLRLTGTDSGELLDLTGELQALGLHLGHLSYSLSPEKRRATSDSLLAGALEQLQHKADEVASLLDKREARLIDLTLNDNNAGGHRRETLAAMEAGDRSVATPEAEPGKTEVSISVNARALLQP